METKKENTSQETRVTEQKVFPPATARAPGDSEELTTERNELEETVAKDSEATVEGTSGAVISVKAAHPITHPRADQNVGIKKN